MAPKKNVQDRISLSKAHSGTPPNSPTQSPSESATSQDAEKIHDPNCSCSCQLLGNHPLSSSPPVTREDLKQLLLELIRGTSKSPEDVKLDALEDDQAEIVHAVKLEFKTVNEIWDKMALKYKIVESLKSKDEIEELDRYVFVLRVRIDRNTEERTSYIDIKSEVLRDVLKRVLREVHGVNLGEDKLTVEANLIYHYLPELESHRRTLVGDSSDDNDSPDDDTPDDDTLDDDTPDDASNDDASNDDASDASDDNTPGDTPDDDMPKSLNAVRKEHLNLLIEHIKTSYTCTLHSLFSLQERKEITFDLLWALFKPGALVYTTCFGTHKPRCVIYDSGEEKKSKSNVKYYEMECRYIDFDGEAFGDASLNLVIPEFHGTKRINTLTAFPLQYHADESGVRADLLKCGRKFTSLIGTHHRHCCGKAFFMYKGDAILLPVNSRIMIDAAFFWKQNPNYSRPRIIKPVNWALDCDGFYNFCDLQSELDNQVQSNGKRPEELKENELLTCCPTVLAFSLSDKIWAEFAVADIENIEWSKSLFNCLSIPNEQKDVLMALAETHIGRTQSENQIGEVQSVPFDDFVAGKGRGLTVLLHGPPGVGKTLTAEAISEHLKRPLYSISAGELNTTAADLERQLSRIFEIARHWHALLLLDEADVYVEQRSTQDLVRNSLVSVFLRKLEYCKGIIFLTTNRVSQFDVAILSRVHLMLKYDDLSKEARRKIWEQFIERAGIAQGEIKADELKCLVNNKLNGRQIKNAMATALVLAKKQGILIGYLHLQTAVNITKKFVNEFNGRGGIRDYSENKVL